MRFELPPVPDVLRVRCGSQVRLSIVQAVMVDVVAEHTGGNIDEKTVHLEIFSLFLFSVRQRVYGVPGARAFLGVPFVGPQPVVIFGIDDGEFSARQRDFPESVAVPYPPIYKHQPKQRSLQPARNVQNDLDIFLPPGLLIDQEKF